jgi:cellulose synthase/poly-beta-1,6-N-acetylglucosamine synthase-like glycosyltransferase
VKKRYGINKPTDKHLRNLVFLVLWNDPTLRSVDIENFWPKFFPVKIWHMKDNLNTHLIVVIPAYNEVECIASVLQNWLRFLEHSLSNTTFNLLVINDGSTDGTGDLLDALAKRESRLKVIHQMNGGHGNAVLNGYRMALMHHPDFVFQVDSDDQFLPEDFCGCGKRETIPIL